MKLKVSAIHDPEIVLSMDYYAVQIMQPHLVLVLSKPDGFIVAAGKMPNFRKVQPKPNTWPRYTSVQFDRGLEPMQAQPSPDGESLLISAAGLLKLAVIFKGNLTAFLTGNSLLNAQRFLTIVAAPMAYGIEPLQGSVARYSFHQVKDNWEVRTLLNV